uniref:Uncharacterized protein n=1 Tax=Physcomitrium patens TaxID=3218 RepID=A0A2K1JRY0_PHYPA|nr:hypothetical protein PHYPA_016610 [Physcomitrium patens]
MPPAPTFCPTNRPLPCPSVTSVGGINTPPPGRSSPNATARALMLAWIPMTFSIVSGGAQTIQTTRQTIRNSNPYETTPQNIIFELTINYSNRSSSSQRPARSIP